MPLNSMYFKVKTTSPKRYCVRPNVGIIKPKSTYNFTVTMQALKSAPSDMQCKDKFLIQSTVVPYGTSEEEITSIMFVKEGQKYVEETKLRVVLTSAPNSPEKPRASVVFKQESSYDFFMPKEPYSQVLLPVDGVNKQETHYETPVPKDTLQDGVDNPQPPGLLMKPVEVVKIVKNMEESRSPKVADSDKLIPVKEEFYADSFDKLKQLNDLEEVKLELMKEIEDLRSKISAIDLKLVEAKIGARKIQLDSPPLFLCMVALISFWIGILYRA